MACRGKRKFKRNDDEGLATQFDIFGRSNLPNSPYLFPLDAPGIRGRVCQEDYPTPKTSVLGRAGRGRQRTPLSEHQREQSIGDTIPAFEYGLMGLGNSQLRVLDRATTNGNTPFDINTHPFNDEVTFPWVVSQVITQEVYRQFDAGFPDFWERE